MDIYERLRNAKSEMDEAQKRLDIAERKWIEAIRDVEIREGSQHLTPRKSPSWSLFGS